MIQRRILAIDPGITTGYAYVEQHEDELLVSVWESRDTVSDFWNLLDRLQPMYVVIEDFNYRPNKKTEDKIELFSLELIGVAELYVGLDPSSGRVIARQTAGEGKGHFSDDKLNMMGIGYRGIHHSRDALRHFMHWFTFKSGYQFNNHPTIKVQKRTP